MMVTPNFAIICDRQYSFSNTDQPEPEVSNKAADQKIKMIIFNVTWWACVACIFLLAWYKRTLPEKPIVYLDTYIRMTPCFIRYILQRIEKDKANSYHVPNIERSSHFISANILATEWTFPNCRSCIFSHKPFYDHLLQVLCVSIPNIQREPTTEGWRRHCT